jgi:hypothetical protein
MFEWNLEHNENDAKGDSADALRLAGAEAIAHTFLPHRAKAIGM